MQKIFFWLCGALALLLCTACGGLGVPSTHNQAPPTKGGSATDSETHQAGSAPTKVLTMAAFALTPRPQGCPLTVSATTYWGPIVGTQPGVSVVSSVTCDTLTTDGSQQALVQVTQNSTPPTLDLYVYGNLNTANPKQLFSLLQMQGGSVRISPYHTLIMAEIDPNSSLNKNAGSGAVQDLFREFKWSDTIGTFAPIPFPGLYPDLTRYQAETNQQDVNQGHQPWKLDARQVANALAVNLLKWPASSTTTIASGGGPQDLSAVVYIKSPDPGTATITLSLSRLESQVNGIWEVTDVETNSMALIEPIPLNVLNSPVTVAGTGNAFEAVIGRVIVLDHLYTNIGEAQATGQDGMGNTTFSTSVSYASTFKAGQQEGIVELLSFSQANSSISGVVMLKELLA